MIKQKIIIDKKKIEELLTRGVENVYPNKKFLEDKLKSGERLSLYLGIDPTGPSLHLGHGITLMKLREFQDLGHKVILLIGSFTAMIGDPTDKSAIRKQLTREEVMENCKNYKKQANMILDSKKIKWKFNHEWFDKMSFREVVDLASNFTVQQMLERDMFEKRMGEGKPVGLHEFLYPLMQGYDSVVMDVDGEIGGNDQTFNMLAGRTLMKALKNKEKFVLTNKLLEDATGKKMGKTEGNMVSLDNAPEDMYGKIMSWPDELIIPGFEICTRVFINKNEIKNNPRDAKMKLAKEIVKIYYSDKEASEAESHFIKTVQKKEVPDEIETKKVKVKKINIIDLLVEVNLVKSKGEARRLIAQNGIKIDGEVINDVNAEIKINKNGVLVQRGKRMFVKVFN
ncbi:MAG: tyrosine--tRNA ligase [Candidatus Falkowbacteria bacterium]